MKYMLLIYGDEKALNDSERETCYQESVGLVHDLNRSGHFVSAAPLHATSLAASVRVREGRSMVTDGPFAETHEQLGGFFMVDVASADEAMEIAKRIPGARWGTVEVRPVVELSGMPGK
jgi:hypothetical protein